MVTNVPKNKKTDDDANDNDDDNSKSKYCLPLETIKILPLNTKKPNIMEISFSKLLDSEVHTEVPTNSKKRA